MDTNALAWSFNGIGLLVLVVTAFYLHRSFGAVKNQIDLLRSQQYATLRINHFDAWSRLDSMLVQYPELTELWIEPDAVEKLRARQIETGGLAAIYRQRAFASMIFELYSRSFRMRREIDEAVGGNPLDEVRLQSQELCEMWYDGGIKSDHMLFPEYVDFVERCLLADCPRQS